MAVSLPWIKKKKEIEPSLSARDQNTEEENALLDLAIDRWTVAKAEKVDHRGRFLNDKWRELDRIYRGDQWRGNVPEYKSTPVLNFTFSLVESVVPRLTDNRPEVLVMADNPAHDNLADMLNKLQSYFWYTNRMQKKIEEAARMVLKYGTSIFKIIWDVDALDGQGNVLYEVVHPMNFFPDPRAYTVDQMDYCFVSVPKPLEYFMRRWPKKGVYVTSDQDWADTETIEGSDQSSQEQIASLKEYWFRDEHGDVCCMYYAGGIVLEIIGGEYDGSNEPVYRHNRFPFAKFVDYPVDKEFWGIGEIEIVELLQRLINSFEAQIIDNTRLMANAQWVINKVESGLREEDAWIFDNIPGSQIFTHQGGVDKIPGTPIPRHIPEHIERLVFAMEQILGIHDVVQGRRPVGVRSASAIIALQESANARVRQKATQLEYALVEVADQGNWLALEFMDEPRQSRVTGTSEAVTLDIRKALDMALVDKGVEVGMVEPGIYPEDMEEEVMDELHQELKYPEFDVQVKVGSSVPYSQALLWEQSKELYQIGAIDQQALLEVTNFPNREAILARMQEQAEAQMMGERVGERTF